MIKNGNTKNKRNNRSNTICCWKNGNNRRISISIRNRQKSTWRDNRKHERRLKTENGYQLCTKKEYYEYIYPILDKRTKPNLSTAALETLAIIAYNQRTTRAEIEAIRGVNSDATIYKLLDYGLIEDAGKADLPGRPTTYKTTTEFLKMFGYESLANLPELPRYKLDANRQVVIDELIEEAPMPEKGEQELENSNKEE